jgi:thiosulfate/3-mercaptopyruvate sulfurtransferase
MTTALPFPMPLISAAALHQLIDQSPPGPTLLDVRWQLASGADRDAFLAGHIPGASFIDLDTQLAGPPGLAGRHPMPDADQFGADMRDAGVNDDRPVVTYDGANATAAARAWWLLRYFGHSKVAVLDGGLASWIAAGYPLATGAPPPQPGVFEPRPGGMPIVDASGAARLAEQGILLDARAPERFQGVSEPIDPVAGHIPGARNFPTLENVEVSGHFREPAKLLSAFERAGVSSDAELGAYCGSGVTAAHEVLALELAGYRASLYPGSWSEWITDPSRPVASGDGRE